MLLRQHLALALFLALSPQTVVGLVVIILAERDLMPPLAVVVEALKALPFLQALPEQRVRVLLVETETAA
jgi:hypothetical protein